MKRLLKIIGLLGIGLALFLAAVLFTFYRLVQVGELRQFFISEIEARTHLRVSIGPAKLRMGKIVGISFSELALTEPDTGRPVITAEKTVMRVALLPLLERKIVFYQMRFYRPTVRIEQDAQGRISLSSLTAYFPVQKQDEGQFALDLREIKIEQGEVIFADHRQEPGAVVAHLREVDLDLRRIQARDLPRPASEASSPAAAQGEEGLAVEFGLKTAVEGEKDGSKARLNSRGKILFPTDGFDLRQIWLDAETKIEGLPASLFWAYYGRLLPAKEIRGILAPNLRWQGSLARHVRVQGQVDFKQLVVDAPDLFPGAVTPGDGHLELEMEWTPREARFTRVELRSQEINLSAQGSVRSLGEKEPLLEVNLATPFLPLPTARKYFPSKALDSAFLESLVNGMNQGELKLTKAGVSGPLSGLRHLFEPGFEDLVSLDIEFKEAGGNLPGGRYLPLRGVSGRVVLEKGVLYYKNFRGMYGLSRLADVEGSQKGILSGRRVLELRARGEADLSQLREQLKLGFMPEQTLDVLKEFSGRGRFGFLLRTDFAAARHYEGQLSLDNARVRVGDVALTQVKGDLSFSPSEIRAQRITGLLGGLPVLMRVVLGNYLTERAAFDLTVDSSGVKAGDALRFLLALGSPQDPGMVHGSLHYYGSLFSAAERNLSGSLELIGVQIPFKSFRQPFRDVRGRVTFDGKGFELQGVKAQVDGYGIDFSGRWRYLEKPQLLFTLNAPQMDIAYLLPHEERRENDWYDRLQARGRIRIGKGRYEGFEFSDLDTALALEKRVWRLENFSAKSSEGTVQGSGTFTDAVEGLRFSVEPKIQGVPIQGFLKWFDTGTRELTGNVNLNGQLESQGATGAERKRNLTGRFQLEIKDGLAKRMQLFVRILNVMDLTRWFSFQLPDLKQQGIRFRSVTGDFKVKQGVYSTENLVVDSDDISITGTGNYDGPNDVVDAVLALRPFPRLGSVVSYIPLIGPGIAGIKDSVLVTSFHVQGPVDDAVITPAPLSTLSEFFFSTLKIPQKMITIPGTGKK